MIEFNQVILIDLFSQTCIITNMKMESNRNIIFKRPQENWQKLFL